MQTLKKYGKTTLKRCTRCNIEKTLKEYTFVSSKSNRLNSQCKKCRTEKSARWRKSHSKRYKSYLKRWRTKNRKHAYKLGENWRRENPLKAKAIQLTTMARARAKEYGLPFNITSNNIFEKLSLGVCEQTKLRFEYHKDGKTNPCSPSIDRIVPKKGYVKGNIRLIVWALNAFKNRFSDDEIYPVAKAFIKYYKKSKRRV